MTGVLPLTNWGRRLATSVTLAALLASAIPTVPIEARPLKRQFGTLIQVPARACEAPPAAAREISNFAAVRVEGVPDSFPYCRVTGLIHGSIGFELRMPENWNGKFLMAGCGGFCGSVLADAPVFKDAVARGYATVTTDTGHKGVHALDARWAKGNPAAKEDFSWRAVRETTRIAKLMVQAHYGRSIAYSYYDGCSNGGRQGLVEATRFPGDYDGIVAGAPAQDVVGLTTLFAWTAASDTDAAGNAILRPSSIDLLSAAVAKACGDQQGLIEAPDRCSFQPSSLLCQSGASLNCLSAAEVSVVEKFYRGPHDSAGHALSASGEPFGSERFWRPDGGPHALQPLKMAAKGLVGFIATDPEPGETYEPSRASSALAWSSPRAIARSIAFRRWGALSVMVATAPSVSRTTSSPSNAWRVTSPPATDGGVRS